MLRYMTKIRQFSATNLCIINALNFKKFSGNFKIRVKNN